ncbi:MAG: hypothetical protein P1U77_06270 [Rubripirellula sp.]|nr:hypothetical protein [Rubripirellula sp.]
MKNIPLMLIVLEVAAACCIQVPHARGQESGRDEPSPLQVIDPVTDERLQSLFSRLDVADSTTERLARLVRQPSGKIALAGHMSTLTEQARNEARLEAASAFIEQFLERDDQGHLIIQNEEMKQRWIARCARLEKSMAEIQGEMVKLAADLETSSEAAGLFKRLFEDPQAAITVRMSVVGGDDAIAKYLLKALGDLLVEQADGTLQMVESRRQEAKQQVERLEMTDDLGRRLQQDLPHLANEYGTDGQRNQQLIRYLRNPLMARLLALEISKDIQSVPIAVERLHEHFEAMSLDTPAGWEFSNDEAWKQMQKFFAGVDRVEKILPRVGESLTAMAERLESDDPLTRDLADKMRQQPLAVALALQVPYSEANAGQVMRALLQDLITEQDGKWKIDEGQELAASDRARELLKQCRRVRRYTRNLERLLKEKAGAALLEELGEAAPYFLTNEIRRYAQQHRSDPVQLLQDDLLEDVAEGKLRVRAERRETVRHLVAQAERVRGESTDDDF